MYTRDSGVRQMNGTTSRARSRALAPTFALAAAVALPFLAAPLSAQRTPEPSRTCDSCDLEDSLAAVQREYEEVRSRYQQMASKMLRRRMEAARAQMEATRPQREMVMSNLRSMESNLRSMQRMPAGWLGCTFSGSYSVTQKDGGKAVMRFDDYPTIEAVEPGSPAEKGGIHAGDKLLSLNGQDLTEGSAPFSELLQPGSRLAVKVKRGRETKKLTVTVGKRPQNYGYDWGGDWDVAVMPDLPTETPFAAPPDWPSMLVTPAPAPAPRPRASVSVRAMPAVPAVPPAEGWSMAFSGPMLGSGFESGVIAGAQVQRVDELSEYFGVDDGLLVLHVVPGTPAARAGLRAGDVIRRAGDRAITSPTSLQRALSASDSPEMKLDIVRKGKKHSVRLKWDR